MLRLEGECSSSKELATHVHCDIQVSLEDSDLICQLFSGCCCPVTCWQLLKRSLRRSW